MILTHDYNQISKTAADASFLLVNKRGSYYWIANQDLSHFQGLHTLYQNKEGWSYYKLIDALRLDQEPTELVNHLFYTERKGHSWSEKQFLLNHGMMYEVNNATGTAILDLDFRDIYDTDTRGRIYKVERENDLVLITYTKYADDALSAPQHQYVLAIRGLEEYTVLDQWIAKTYTYDRFRGTPSTRWVYRCLSFSAHPQMRLFLAWGATKREAANNLHHLASSQHHVLHLEHTYLHHLKRSVPVARKPVQTAYVCALRSLENLLLNLSFGEKKATGMFAGLPWFFQFWSRDELISLHALVLERKYALAKIVLFKHLDALQQDGRIPNRTPFAQLGTADGIGWLAKRTLDFIHQLTRKNLLNEYLTPGDLAHLYKCFGQALDRLEDTYLDEGLMRNQAKETWMDTVAGNDTREGKRLEINVQYVVLLNLLVTLGKLTKNNPRRFKQKERQTIQAIRKAFLHQGLLYDGVNDPTQRPNIFLAHYLFPPLFTRREWKRVFTNALQVLWLPWGGLASIDQSHHLFCSHHTGENNQSYHRGDSWYFCNNLAALALHRVDKKAFRSYIQSILSASTDDILFQGFLGHASELSSAQEQEPAGCWCQAWSNATYLELVRGLTRQERL